jgi:hypothetical protein
MYPLMAWLGALLLSGVKRTSRLHWSNSLSRRTVLAVKKGRSMALDTNTFLIVLAAAVIVMGFVVWMMFKKTS